MWKQVFDGLEFIMGKNLEGSREDLRVVFIYSYNLFGDLFWQIGLVWKRWIRFKLQNLILKVKCLSQHWGIAMLLHHLPSRID